MKVKGPFGGSVSPEITQQIEARLSSTVSPSSPSGSAELAFSPSLSYFDPWSSYCDRLRTQVKVEPIRAAINSGRLRVFADVMHGAAAGGLGRILECEVQELHSARDPLFGGYPPEPLPRYLSELLETVKTAPGEGLKVGLVFDGDSDRIAAVDAKGNFLSTQILIPILMDHLVDKKGLSGEVVKTVSGSDIIPRLAKLYNLPIFETPIGYKYIADRMLTSQVLIGGEESGGVGYGTHIPERDALLSALYVLEAVVESGVDLSDRYTQLQEKAAFISAYDRIDLPLASMEVRSKLLTRLETDPPKTIAGQSVIDCLAIDGYKFRLQDGSWLLIRFSGTEPILRLYCEAANLDQVHLTLNWAKDWANSV